MSDTDLFIQSLQRKQGARVGTMLTLDPANPDEVAENIRVGADLGLPANVVAADPQGFKRQLAQKKASTVLSGAPKTRQWLSDLQNGALAKDDVENLSWFEGYLSGERVASAYTGIGQSAADTQFGRGVQTGAKGAQQIGTALTAIPAQGRGAQNARLLDLYERVGESDQSLTVTELADTLGINPMSLEASFAHGFLTADADKRQGFIASAAKALASDKEAIGAITQSLDAFSADMQKVQGRTPNFSDIEDVKSFADWFAFNSGQSLPYLAITALAGLATGGVGVLGSGYAMGVGDINSEMLQQGITDQPNIAIVGGAPYAALELLGPAARPFRGVSGTVLETVAEGYFKRALKDIPANAVEEFINEAGQEIIKDIAVAEGGGEEVTLDDATLLRWFDAGMAGAAGGVSVSAISTAMTPSEARLARDMDAAAKAGTTAQTIDQIDRMAAASKLKQRSPDKFAEALDAQGGADFYVPAEDLREYFQAKDVAFDDETMAAWGIDPAEFAVKESAGEDVAISRATYAARISGTEDAAWFREYATMAPGEMSVSEAARFNEEVRDVMDKAIAEAEQRRQDDLEVRASDVQVYDSIYTQLREAGRTKDVADNEARVWSSFWRTMGERYGADPLDLARSMGVEIRGPQSPEASRRRNELDIKLNTLRANPEKALKPSDVDLLTFIRGEGGIADVGGDVEAMGAPKGVIAETRADYEARRGQPNLTGGVSEGLGKGLDDLGRAAIEAGYFPELLGGADIQADGTVVDEAAVLLEALQRAIAGEAIYPVGEGADPDLTALYEALQERGLDLREMSNDEIAAALEEADGREYDQGGRRAIENVADAVLNAIGGRADGFEYVGLRVTEESLAVGEDVPPSRVWVDGDPTDDILEGASAVQIDIDSDGPTREGVIAALETMRSEGYFGRHVSILGSNRAESGVDRNEIVLGDAEVLAQFERDGDMGEIVLPSDPTDEQSGRIMYQTAPATDTPAFKAWFGDSKVVDADGKPLVVYHGSPDVRGILSDGFAPSPSRGGVYFASDSQRVANTYADDRRALDYQNAEPHVVPLYLSLQNPLVVDAKGAKWRDTERHVQEARDGGHDGIVIKNSRDEYNNTGNGGETSTVYAVFEPTQMKSAMDSNLRSRIDGIDLGGGPNRGTFDGSDPRILYQAAYHGTPHVFDKFSTAAMGTGEGAQAFGWGMYFAGRKGVAEFYRDKLSKGPTLFLDGEQVGSGYIGHKLTEHIKAAVPPKDTDFVSGFETYSAYLDWFKMDAVHAMSRLENGSGIWTPRQAFDAVWAARQKADPPYDDEAASVAKMTEAALDFFDQVTATKPGRLYRVEVPDVDQLLDWDKPITQQPDYVANIARNIAPEVLDTKSSSTWTETKETKRKKRHFTDQFGWEVVDHGGWFTVLSNNGANIIEKNTAKEAKASAENARKYGVELVDGKGLYKFLSRKMGGEKEASLALNAAGIPGHRFLDGGSRSNGDGSHNYVIYDDEAVKILEFEQQKRGSIVLPSGGLENGQTVINLFEGANLSTFLHESGHFFLEAFTALASDSNAPQAMRDDLAAIHKFLDVPEGGATPTLSTEQHEKWARGFEAYALEGKAPSLELADAFGRFKAWLTRIYKTALGLNVKLTPEIREVMDRMLATDAEIVAAREAQQMSPLFTDQAASGMSDAAWSTYQRMARRSEEQASQALLEKTMAKVRREKEKWWKDERADVRKEVTATINSKPEYRLIEMLANRRWIGSDQEVPDFQLDRKELVEAFGEGVLPELSRARFGGKRAIYGADGVSLSEAADFFGFANPSEMIETLQNTGKRQDAIELETDRIMSDRYGDPLNDGSIEEEAVAAIHSEQQAQTVASEVRHLAGQAGKSTRNLTAKVFRQRARMMLGRMSVKEATRPDAFLAAERKAAKRAEDAFARVARGRDSGAALATAAKHKEQQLLNHYLYMESRDLSKLVASRREKMRDYSKKSVRGKLDGGYIEQIDAILEGYDFRVRSAGQVQRSENLRQFVERMTEEGRAAELAIDDRLMDEANRKHYTRLSVDELHGLFDTIDNLDHMGRFKQKLQDAKDARDLDEVVSGVLGEFEANVSGEPPNRTPTASEARRKLGRDYLNTVLNADTLLREVDGFKDIGPTWKAMKERVDEGMNRVTERRVQMAKSFDAIYDVYSAKEKRDMSVKRQNDALGGLFSKWDLISLALNTGNADNFQRLTNPKIKGSFKQADIEAALSVLDNRDWQTVQNIWDYIDSFWPEIAAKEKRQTGTVPTKVEAQQIVSAPGFVKGGYYPIKFDSRLSGLAKDFQQKDLAQELMGGMFGKAQTRNGHTKERNKTATQPVVLDLGIAHAHVEQVIYDLEIGEPINASWKILHDPRIEDAFRSKGKQSDFEALEIWMQDVAAGERIAAGGLQSIMRHLRSGFTVSRLALNVSTALIQPTGLVQSAVLVGKRAIAKGTIDYMSNIPRWVEDVQAVSSLMRERKRTFERDIYNVVGDLEGGPVTGRWQKFQRDVVLPLSFWMMRATQFYAVDMPTWVSAYQKEIKASGDEAKARTYADLMVKRAQGSGLMSDRGMLERGTLNAQSRQQEFPRMLTALGSYMFAKGNVFYEKARQTDFKNPVQVMSLAADVGLLFTLEAVLYSAVKGYLPEEDEPEEWLPWLASETVYSMASTIPVAREISGAVQGFNGGGIFGSAVEVMAKPMIQAAQGEADKAFVKSVTDAGGVLLHLPSSQTKAVIESVFDNDMSVKSDINWLQAVGVDGGRERSIADIVFGK